MTTPIEANIPILEEMPAEILRQAIAAYRSTRRLNDRAHEPAFGDGRFDAWRCLTQGMRWRAETHLVQAILYASGNPKIAGKVSPEKRRWPAQAVACGSEVFLVIPDPNEIAGEDEDDRWPSMVLAVLDRRVFEAAMINLEAVPEIEPPGAGLEPEVLATPNNAEAATEFFRRVMGGGR